MDIVICGCGEVGGHAAEVLAQQGHNITVIDQKALRLRKIEDTLDVRTLTGNCADASVLIEAGASRADLLLAATSSDEVNLLSATIAKGVGVEKSIARVHHRAYFDQRGIDYMHHLGIDQVICPEYSAALEIARTLRNPGALAIENFAQGRIEMQEFPVDPASKAVGKSLIDLALPSGSRLAAITRSGQAFIPKATTIIEPEDTIILVGNSQVFQDTRKIFRSRKELSRKKIVIMGGVSMAVWLCRNLLDRNFSVRLFESDRARAEELAQKLDWVTVIQADPTEIPVFEEEHLADAD
ncbi:MAG: Trk system potassium transporter TrkA, partial [Candidatus Omnitrophica bacterium]|nr:Trk system potassium transporter TrkA [Candidatus Omnitrophota bacterium]